MTYLNDTPSHQVSNAHRVLELAIQLTGLTHVFQFFKNISLASPQGIHWIKNFKSNLLTAPNVNSKSIVIQGLKNYL